MKTRKSSLFALLLIALAIGLTGCMSDDDGGAAGTTGTQTMEGMDMDAGAPTSSPATDLRLTLDRLLGEHALLASFAMQKGAGGEQDFDAIADALEGNTVDLGEAIGSVYGDEAEQSFLTMWREHIGFFVDFTVATAKKNEAGQKAALDKLAGYRESFANFLGTATDGNLPAAGAADALQAHVDQLTAALTTYVGGDFAAAYGQVREAYAHMFMTGDAISGAIVEQSPDEFPAEDVSQSASDLRITLGRLLGEHAGLAVFAMQKGVSGAKDFDAIAAVLDTNTVDLGKAIGSVYGAEAEQSFLKLWREHIGFFVEYTVATAKDDEAGRNAALDKLAGYRESFASFLDTATEGKLPAEGAADALQAHVEQLTSALDAYAAGDFAAAYEQAREAYAHMYMTADAIANGVVAQSPGDFSS